MKYVMHILAGIAIAVIPVATLLILAFLLFG